MLIVYQIVFWFSIGFFGYLISNSIRKLRKKPQETVENTTEKPPEKDSDEYLLAEEDLKDVPEEHLVQALMLNTIEKGKEDANVQIIANFLKENFNGMRIPGSINSLSSPDFHPNFMRKSGHKGPPKLTVIEGGKIDEPILPEPA